jgi:hypothetical protein
MNHPRVGSEAGDSNWTGAASRLDVVPCIQFQSNHQDGKRGWVWLKGGWCWAREGRFLRWESLVPRAPPMRLVGRNDTRGD